MSLNRLNSIILLITKIQFILNLYLEDYKNNDCNKKLLLDSYRV